MSRKWQTNSTGRDSMKEGLILGVFIVLMAGLAFAIATESSVSKNSEYDAPQGYQKLSHVSEYTIEGNPYTSTDLKLIKEFDIYG